MCSHEISQIANIEAILVYRRWSLIIHQSVKNVANLLRKPPLTMFLVFGGMDVYDRLRWRFDF